MLSIWLSNDIFRIGFNYFFNHFEIRVKCINCINCISFIDSFFVFNIATKAIARIITNITTAKEMRNRLLCHCNETQDIKLVTMLYK